MADNISSQDSVAARPLVCEAVKLAPVPPGASRLCEPGSAVAQHDSALFFFGGVVVVSDGVAGVGGGLVVCM